VLPELTYQQSLKVMWLILWRSLVLSLAALVVVSLIFRLLGVNSFGVGEQNPLGNNLGLTAVDALTTLVFAPFIIPGMLRKRYRGFRLQLVEDAPAASIHTTRKKL
jgi:hypothetical protein